MLTDDDWKRLRTRTGASEPLDLRTLFAADDARAERLTFTAGDLTVDLSKHLIDDNVLDALLSFGETALLERHRDAMFAGDRINQTEMRSVLHTALRLPHDASLVVDGIDVVPEIHAVLDHMTTFAQLVRTGSWTGATGQRIETVINIGIGGSDLGPAMAARALAHHSHPEITFHFVSNVDGADLAMALEASAPESTLFIVASKTLSTIETLTNATNARNWLTSALGVDAVARHFVALSTNTERVTAFGIDASNMFEFWDWVGGRYSMDSAIGLSTMIAIGPAKFKELLAGLRTMDEHFLAAPLAQNVPVLMALIGVLYRNIHNLQSMAVLPYSEPLSRFPAYLQQLDMESNGKSVRMDGSDVIEDTGPVVWRTGNQRSTCVLSTHPPRDHSRP